MNKYKLTRKDGAIYTSQTNDFTQWEEWMGLPERIINASEPHDAEDVLEEIPEVLAYEELVVNEILQGDELLETIEPAPLEGEDPGDSEPGQTQYSVRRPRVVEPAKVRLRAEYTIEAVDITAELQEKAISQEADRVIKAGNEIIKLVSIRNAKKQISTAQTLAFVQAFAGIVQLLQVGALQTAREGIVAIEPNELVSQEDKDYVLELLNQAIGDQ